jgi:hypothetical protein
LNWRNDLEAYAQMKIDYARLRVQCEELEQLKVRHEGMLVDSEPMRTQAFLDKKNLKSLTLQNKKLREINAEMSTQLAASTKEVKSCQFYMQRTQLQIAKVQQEKTEGIEIAVGQIRHEYETKIHRLKGATASFISIS